MRALRSCDFCGEQAVGTFEVIPEELEPTESERRRVILCESCKETVQQLIEPLVERAGGTADSEEDSSKNAGTTEAGSAENDAESTDSETANLIESSTDDDGSLLGESDDEDDAADSEASGTENDGEDGDAESSSSSSNTQTTQNVKSERPDNYGQVLRLLRNREFPMSREEVVTIATSAYQLKPRNVQAIIDEAVDRGEFVESNGQLQNA